MLRGAAALLLTFLACAPLGAQEWRAGAQFGRVKYAGAAADAARASTFSVGASRVGVTDWYGASVSLPVNDVPFWAVAGAWKRWRPEATGHFALDASAHAFFQRERDSGTTLPLPMPDEPESSGQGVGGELAAVGLVGHERLRAEVRAGASAQASRISDVATTTLLPFGEARVLYEAGRFQAGPDVKAWFGDSTSTYAGIAAYGSYGPVDAWGTAGRWQSGSANGFSLGLGAALPLGNAVRLEADYRSSGFDPLYGNETSSSITIGASVRLAGSNGVSAPVPARYENGRALIRLRARDVSGRPRIAGDFNNWKPQPMTAVNGEWTFTVALKPGVYNYAFVDEAGEWFVPESTPGRRSDGMGGWQAVLVVS